MKRSLFYYKCLSYGRNFAKYVNKQDPEEVKNMPIFQYATKNTKRSKRVYVWGNALCGALGNPNFIMPNVRRSPLKAMHKPCRLQFGDTHKINDIACGYGFTVFAGSHEDNDFTLFGTGLNSDFQIGYHCSRKNIPLESLAQPVPISLPVINQKTKATKVSCGRAHTIVLTDKEGVFSLGNNAYGQCGTKSDTHSPTDLIKIHKVENLPENIVQIVCGQDHSLFLDSSGQVYSCGWGADGQTGLGHCNNQEIPCRVKGDIEKEKIVQIACTADCVLAVSENGDVFGWGNSEYMQLNMVTDEQQLNVPTYLDLNIGKVLQVASGGTICAALNEKGNVFVWGYGILGQGPNVTMLEKPSLLPEPLFGANEFDPEVKVKQIFTGLSHFAAINNHGHLYMWGRNRSNCLGLGRDQDQFFPYKVSVPAEVSKVSCGIDHTAALCRSFA